MIRFRGLSSFHFFSFSQPYFILISFALSSFQYLVNSFKFPQVFFPSMARIIEVSFFFRSFFLTMLKLNQCAKRFYVQFFFKVKKLNHYYARTSLSRLSTHAHFKRYWQFFIETRKYYTNFWKKLINENDLNNLFFILKNSNIQFFLRK